MVEKKVLPFFYCPPHYLLFGTIQFVNCTLPYVQFSGLFLLLLKDSQLFANFHQVEYTLTVGALVYFSSTRASLICVMFRYINLSLTKDNILDFFFIMIPSPDMFLFLSRNIDYLHGCEIQHAHKMRCREGSYSYRYHHKKSENFSVSGTLTMQNLSHIKNH